MKFQLTLPYRWTAAPITHNDRFLLLGSCFTTHLGQGLYERGFRHLANPTGICFDPTAISRHLHFAAQGFQVDKEALFYLNECYAHWDFHSDFSHPDPEQACTRINQALSTTAAYLKNSSWLVITFGSAFRYVRNDSQIPVANNHRADAAGFYKELLTTQQIVAEWTACIAMLRQLNPGLQLLFTVSPVRHIRDGVIENNRSKARLLDAVHSLCESLPECYYFPSYELVIDILRDHRWYDLDLVHPNHAATQYVVEQFAQLAFTQPCKELAAEVQQLHLSLKHQPRFPESLAHKKFLADTRQRLMLLSQQLPWLNQLFSVDEG